MSGAIVLSRTDQADLALLGAMLKDSGMFKDVHSEAAAAAKILAGREMGLSPVDSMRSFHQIGQALEPTADLYARLVRRHPRYDYRVLVLDEAECSLEFTDHETGDKHISTFTEADRERAGLGNSSDSTWRKFPRNLMFARAMSNGVGWYCPDVVDAMHAAAAAAGDVVDESGSAGIQALAGPDTIAAAAAVVEVGEPAGSSTAVEVAALTPGDEPVENLEDAPEVDADDHPEREAAPTSGLEAEDPGALIVVETPEGGPAVVRRAGDAVQVPLPADEEPAPAEPAEPDPREALWERLQELSGRTRSGARSIVNVVHKSSYTGAREDEITAAMLEQAIAVTEKAKAGVPS